MERKRLNLILYGAAALLVIIVLAVWFTAFSLPVEPVEEDVEVTEETESDLPKIDSANESLIDGLPIREEKEQSVAVIIENHTDARRQQAGLGDASLVIEAEAEGGITRFLAIFPYQKTEKVGPVRSARPYTVRWAEMFDSAFVHAGGSDLGFSTIYSSGRILDLDGLALEGGLKYFTRDHLYYAPHNLFANLVELRELAEERGWDSEVEEPVFKFGSSLDNGEVIETADTVRIYYPWPQYYVRYEYDSEDNVYKRYQAGETHIDKNTGDQIAPSNVVVMITNYYPTDEEGRLYMKTEGKGDMYLFRNGKVFPGTWERYTTSDVLKFYAEDGEELNFEKGPTWISVVNQTGGMQWE
ncbi:DUF3048 domain-containing protein [Patescibacteria group bacterium]